MISSLVSDGLLVRGSAPDPAVPWWSFTKTVLAAAALSLVRDGLVALDDTAPEGPFTLRQLLQHEAGLADYGELAEYHAAVASNEAPWAAQDMLSRLDAGRLRYAPGGGWRYSNVGYLYVARLIERVTGLALDQALRQRVLAPLGSLRAQLLANPSDVHRAPLGLAPGYHPGWVYHGLLAGPLSDAALLLDRLLAGHLLPASLLQEMQAARPLGGPLPGRPWVSPGYGLGLMQGAIDGGLTLCGHTGTGPASTVAIYRCAQGARSATCAVFTDAAGEGAAEAARQLSAVLMDRPGGW